MRISVHAGHNPAGKIACGAVGVLDESVENRKVKEYLITYLKNQGHTVYDCTCDNGTGQTDVLRKIVAKCNAHSVDVDISLHLNSGGGHGTECLIYGTGGQAEVYANKIQSAIVKRTGFANRGVKVRKDLYVLKNTAAPAVLVECCFVDSATDAKMWSPKAMAAAICEGLTGKNPLDKGYLYKAVTTDVVNVREKPSKDSTKVTTMKKGANITVVAETANWVQRKHGGWIAKKYIKKT
ncbi:MAG: N-acetylmuramoyl-L-alanine amidase [Butyricicoccus sp.]